ncbi:hypothetical protein CAL7716_057700 [Calothrix sp. PCC 7716]|nr:hypothetical protein CAL7716_057700 [Calothrix sp. PCC 7716]
MFKSLFSKLTSRALSVESSSFSLAPAFPYRIPLENDTKVLADTGFIRVLREVIVEIVKINEAFKKFISVMFTDDYVLDIS